jgi:hypothetical protein
MLAEVMINDYFVCGTILSEATEMSLGHVEVLALDEKGYKGRLPPRVD